MIREFEDSKEGDIVIISINVEDATLKYAQRFKNYIQRLIDNGEKKIIVNCQNISYMDSTFLGSLVFSLKKIASSGGDLKLIIGNFDSPVWTMFETTRMFKVFKSYPDIAAAISSFN